MSETFFQKYKLPILIGGGLVLAGIVAAIVIEIKRKKDAGTTSMALSSRPAPQASNYSVQPSYANTADRTPGLATSKDGASLHDMNGLGATGPQPIEADYSSTANLRQAAPDDQWAPVDTMSSNDALSLANPDNAQWFSQNLLPNAELSCANDGMVTDGPTFEELAIFTPNLLEASVASRFFQEPPQLRPRCGGFDIRPTPMVSASAGSRESLTWGISSIQQSDVALDNAARTRLFCT